MLQHERDFEEFLRNMFLSGKNHGSKTIPKEKGVDIVKILKGGDVKVSKFKFWVKDKQFRLMQYPSLGLKDVLCLPVKKKVSKEEGK